MMRRIDLLPAAYVERRRDRRSRGIVVIIAVLVILLLVAWYFMLRMQIATARDELATEQTANAVLENEIAELQEFADLDAEVKAKRTALQTVFAGDIDWPALMTDVAMVVPGEVWIESFSASAGETEGATPVPTETNEIRLWRQLSVGRVTVTGNSASCMPGVAKWLIRLATVDEFEAAWIGSATEADTRPGCEPPVAFDSTWELNRRVLSHRFEGEAQ